MVVNLKNNILLILVVLCILLIIPCSFADNITNEILSADNDDINVNANDETTIYVSNSENDGDGSIDNPYNSISKAVEKYNSSTNSNIYIKNGEYDLEGQINIDKDINIIGESSDNTIINANFKSTIFKISKDVKVTLINLTLKNAKSQYGALYIDSDSNIIINNCTFDNNTEGGAIYHYSYYTGMTLNIKDSVFTNNQNKKNGGAIYCYSGIYINITNTLFENNLAPSDENSTSSGGAIYAAGNIKNIYINYSRFINNTATRGSAISQYCAGDLYIFNSIFENNTSPGNSKYNITSSVIHDNQINPTNLTLYLNNNTISNNILNNDIICEGNVKLIYLDKNTRLTADDVDKYYGDDYNYIVKLTDNEGNPLEGLEIIATLTNKYNNSITTISNITNTQGIAIISLKNQSAGKYSVIAKFNGSNDYDEISISNTISIRTENSYNIIFNPDYVHITEGDSYNATGYIYDEYLVPVNFINTAFSVNWIDYRGKHLIVESGSYLVSNGNKIVFDINRCHLVTRDEVYELCFTVSSIGSGILTVDLSKNLSNINPDIDIIYVSKDGNDTSGDGSQNNPLATIQLALIANNALGGGKTIIIKEGVYEISTFTILNNVTIIGEKAILKQSTGRLGMFEIDDGNTVKLINLTFIDGYATPIPESLIHVTDESIAYIENCEFTNNSAYYGGAIAVSRGGIVYINNSYFHENQAILNTNGAGVLYVERGYAYISNSLFVNNTACDGGVIFLGFEAEADIINSTFINNSAIATTKTEGGGGVIFTRSNNLNIENSSFIGNYAELYGGAIYIDYGAVNITKSYFENNYVKYNGESKGSAIESAYNNYCNLTIHYSILISNDTHSGNYIVYIHEVDEENHTIDLNYNYWKSTSARANPGFSDEVKIIISAENEYIYTGDIVEFTVELVNSNIENGTSRLDGNVHDLNLELVPTIGNITNPFITVKNNKATFIYNATSVGEESILIGDILLYTTYKFDVKDGFDKIDLNPIIDISPDKKTEITITLDHDIDSNITVRIDDNDYSVSVNNSKATLEIDTLPGDYEVKVIYSGSETYKGFVISKSFNVSKYASTITVNNITTYYNGNLEVALISEDRKAIANEILTITINNTEYTVKTNASGIAVLELNLQSVGTYDVITSFSGNNYYNASQAISKITVEFANIILTPEENVIITPINGSFTFKLTDDKNNPIKNSDIIVTFNNTNYTIKTDTKGIATFNLTNNYLEIGEHTIYAEVKENSLYSSNNATSTFNVVKANANLISDNITIYENNGNITVILLDDDGNPINNTGINITINNASEIIKTNENGTVKSNVTLQPGNYKATIKLEENKIYQAEDIVINIYVKETTTSIIAPDITVYYTNGTFNFTLLDVSGKSIANARLIISIDNDYITTTDENGIASININNLAIGTYKATIKFEGNNIFQASNTTANINVISSIISNDVTKAYNSGSDFEAILKDTQGRLLENTTVTFTVNGKQYTSKTDSNGVVKLNEKLAIGTYAITLVNPATGERTSNYANIVSRFGESKNIVMDYYDGSSYKVRIIGDDGKAVGLNEKVTIKLNGKTYSVKTDSKGYASIKITDTPKTYTITSTYKGQSIKNTITIKQILKAGKKTTTIKKSAKKLTLQAILKHTNGKAIKSKKITFKFNGKKYTAKTNSKGIAKVTIKKTVLKKLKSKNYTVTLTYIKDIVKCYVKIK